MVKSAVVAPASDQNAAEVGDTITYSYNVTNNGNVPLTSVAVSDPTAGSVACPTPAPPGLAPGATETCTARTPYLVKQTDVDVGSVTDTAAATGTDATNFTSPTSAPSSTKVPTVAAAPSLLVQKVENASLGNSAPIQAGETIQYSYVITNTGNVDLTSVSVSDPTAGAVTCPTPPAPGLAPGDTETCTANTPYVVTQADVDRGGVTDTATATGGDLHGDTATSPPSTVSTASLPIPAVSVDKTATVTPAGDQNAVKVGDTIQYSYKVDQHRQRRPGFACGVRSVRWQTHLPDAGRSRFGAAERPRRAPPITLYTVTQADVDNGEVDDTATATGTDNQGNASAPSNPSTATVLAVTGNASVSIAKSAAVSPGERPERGQGRRYDPLLLQRHQHRQHHPDLGRRQRPERRQRHLPGPGRCWACPRSV